MGMALLRARKEGTYDLYQSLGRCKFHAGQESQTLTDTSDEASAQRKQKNHRFPGKGCLSEPAKSSWNHPLFSPSCHH